MWTHRILRMARFLSATVRVSRKQRGEARVSKRILKDGSATIINICHRVMYSTRYAHNKDRRLLCSALIMLPSFLLARLGYLGRMLQLFWYLPRSTCSFYDCRLRGYLLFFQAFFDTSFICFIPNILVEKILNTVEKYKIL